MAICRIYLFTYKRNHLLTRALTSLINQDFTDWVCEVHNDCPEDQFPTTYVHSLQDDRFIIKNHPVNLGGTASFNMAFSSSHCDEPFAAMLEDDNWWESVFLSTMIKHMQANPTVEVSVANETIWQEEPDGSWTNTKQTVRPAGNETELFAEAKENKCGPAIICNSALMWRTRNAIQWCLPNDIPIDVTEHFRERLIPHPILLVNEPLVNFAKTIDTNRSGGLTWSIYQALLVSSVFVGLDLKERNKLASILWLKARTTQPLFKTVLLHAAFLHVDAITLFKKATVTEILRHMLTWLRRPALCFKIIRAKTSKANHWNFLLKPKVTSS